MFSHLQNAVANLRADGGQGRPSPWSDVWYGYAGQYPTGSNAGMAVSPQTAARISTVFACIRIISEGIASIPLTVFNKDGANRTVANTNPLYKLLVERPNNWQTPAEFFQMLTANAVFRGNGYALILDGIGTFAAQLQPLHPDRVTVKMADDGTIYYTVRTRDNKQLIVPQDLMLHVRGVPSEDGLTGIGVLEAARQSLGLTLAAETFGSTFFRNGARVGGMISHPTTLSDEARQRARDEFNREHGGVMNSHKLLFLDEGMQYNKLTFTNDESQFLETRKFQVEDICRFFRVPPHMVGVEASGSRATVEQQSLEFLMYCLLPWIVKIEQALTRDLVLRPDKLEIRFITDALLRGDASTRATAGSQSWWKTGNELRAIDGLAPLDDPKMNTVQIPLNRGDPGGASKTPNNSNNSPDAKVRLGELVIASCRKVVSAETRELQKIAQACAKSGADFSTKAQEFLVDHSAWAVDLLTPVANVIGAVFNSTPDVQKIIGAHIENLVAAVKGGKLDDGAGEHDALQLTANIMKGL